MTLRPWTQMVRLHQDVERGDTATATYAIDLGALVDNDSSVPRLYRSGREFFSVTHLTNGMLRLLKDVLGGLAGEAGDHVLQLRSPFGGGKSHTLAMLYHAAREPEALRQIPDAVGLPDPGFVRVAVFDGEKFDVQGKQIQNVHVKSLWGNLAAQLGCYDLVKFHDENLVAPGGDIIAKMIGKNHPDSPATLIILDEVLKYLERAATLQVGESYLGRQTLDFLQSLSVEVARTPKAVMIYSLQASNREALGNEGLLEIVDHLTSRVDAKRDPVSSDEILPVLCRRLLEDNPNRDVSREVAKEMSDEVTRLRLASANDDITRRNALDEKLALTDRFQSAYPFHPDLIAILRERWASLPDFQRTRGALRFLAVCMHAVKSLQVAHIVLGPGDIPLQDSAVVQALFTEVGKREPYQAVLARDFFGPYARIPRIDERLARENPSLNSVCPALRIATAILMYSFGGRMRTVGPDEEPVAVGVDENELLGSVVCPELDSITARVALKELREQCLYLHFDGVRYAFKTSPNINQMLEEYSGRVQPNEIDQSLHDEMVNRLRGRAAIIWPVNSQDIPDRESHFLIAYLPFDFALQNGTYQENQALQLLGKHGDVLRQYRNGLGLAIPDANRVNEVRRAMRHMKGIERVRANRTDLNLTPAHMEQLNEFEHNDKVALESGFRNLYQAVWLAENQGGELVLDKVPILGRPLQSTTIHERLIDLLLNTPPHLFRTITPEKIIELMRLGSESGSDLAVTTGKIVETFYRVIGFPRLENISVLSRALADGVTNGILGYVGQVSQVDMNMLREGSSYQVKHGLVQIGVTFSPDQLDMSTGIIVLQRAIAPEEPALPVELQPMPPVVERETESAVQQSEPTRQPEYHLGTLVKLRLRMNRQQLYQSWNALKNLVEKAGTIHMSVEAEKADGFDPAWVRNAVIEPLEEADVDVEEG